MKENRTPVSTVKTGCIPFHRGQKARNGYKVGENPVKENGVYVQDFEEALGRLRKMKTAGWRDFGARNSQSAHKAIGWVMESDAEKLLAEKDAARRVEIFRSLKDVVE